MDHSLENYVGLFQLLLILIIPLILSFIRSFMSVLFGSGEWPNWTTLATVLIFEALHAFGTCMIVFMLLPSIQVELIFPILAACGSVFSILCNAILQPKLIVNVISIVLCVCSLIATALVLDGDLTLKLIFVFGTLLTSFGYWQSTVASNVAKMHSFKFLSHLADICRLYIVHELRNRILFIVQIVKLFIIILFYIVFVHVKYENYVEIGACLSLETLFHGSWWFNVICGLFGSIFASYICQVNLVYFVLLPACALASPIAMVLVLGPTHWPALTRLMFFVPSSTFEYKSFSAICVFWVLQFVAVRYSIFSLAYDHYSEHRRLFFYPKFMFQGEALEQFILFFKRRDWSFYDKAVVQREKRILKKREQMGVGSFRRMESSNKLINGPPYIYACATMWHETYQEMKSLLRSIFRLDKDQERKKGTRDAFHLEAHIYFDDAFKKETIEEVDVKYEDTTEKTTKYSTTRIVPNDFVKDLLKCMKDITSDKFCEVKWVIKELTPYGAKISWILPFGTRLVAHLKDKSLIRHKKRWSQIMYFHYILNFLMSKRCKIMNDRDECLKNTFILALDGDVDFQPEAVHLVMDTLKSNHKAGACCGVIKPLGNGFIFWYQRFEYAVGHWLQKAAEHFLGSVLCSPGCFSLFRGSAVGDDDVAEIYSALPEKPEHYIQYDQGEDRWLCTLLIQKGWRVSYNPNSISYTNAPDNFTEFYNQRRRWGPSTLSNVIDLIMSGRETVRHNDNISTLYIFYQAFLLIVTLLGPSSVLMFIMQSLSYVLSVEFVDGAPKAKENAKDLERTLLIVVVLLTIAYVYLCRYLPSKTQIKIASLLTIIFALIMMVVTGGLITGMRHSFLANPQNLFLILISIIFVTCAVIHGEVEELICGVTYFFLVPSMMLFLNIFGYSNLNNVSWGTREVTSQAVVKREEIAPGKPQNTNVMTQLTNLLPKSNICARIRSWMPSFKGSCFCCSNSSDPELVLELRKLTEKLDGMQSGAPMTNTVDNTQTNAVQMTSGNYMSKMKGFAKYHNRRVDSNKNSYRRTTTLYHKTAAGGMSQTSSQIDLSQMGVGSFQKDGLVELDEGIAIEKEVQEEYIVVEKDDDWMDRSWINNEEMKDEIGRLIFDTAEKRSLADDEVDFFKWLVREKLYPLEDTSEGRKKKEEDLMKLRDKVCFTIYLLNLLWLVFIVVLQGNKAAQFDINLNSNSNSISNSTQSIATHSNQEVLDGLGFTNGVWKFDAINTIMMIMFGTLGVLQFVAMLAVKWDSLKRVMARTDIPISTLVHRYFSRKSSNGNVTPYDNPAFEEDV